MKTSTRAIPRAAALPPIAGFRRASLWIYAILLLPFVLQSGVSWAALGALLLGGACACWMHGVLTPVLRLGKTSAEKSAWEDFHFSWFVFLVGLTIIGFVAFPIGDTRGFSPMWWVAVAAPAAWWHANFLARAGVEMGQKSARKWNWIGFMLLCWVLQLGALSYINGAFDSSEARSQRARVMAKRLAISGRYGNDFRLDVELENGRFASLRVSSQVYSDFSSGDVLRVQLKSGALDAPWIAGQSVP